MKKRVERSAKKLPALILKCCRVLTSSFEDYQLVFFLSSFYQIISLLAKDAGIEKHIMEEAMDLLRPIDKSEFRSLASY